MHASLVKGNLIQLQIERIQNPLLYKRYMVKKDAMEKQKIKDVEQFLWHGTPKDSVHSICRDGFNRAFCGVNGIIHLKLTFMSRYNQS